MGVQTITTYYCDLCENKHVSVDTPEERFQCMKTGWCVYRIQKRLFTPNTMLKNPSKDYVVCDKHKNMDQVFRAWHNESEKWN